MKSSPNDDLYGSGLNYRDWYLFCNILLPFLHAKDIGAIDIPKVPERLINHPFMEAIYGYKYSGNEDFLDKAGKCLVPTDKRFGWYLVVTKA